MNSLQAIRKEPFNSWGVSDTGDNGWAEAFPGNDKIMKVFQFIPMNAVILFYWAELDIFSN